MLTERQLTTQEIEKLDWKKVDNLMPVIVQHAISGTVLMLGYMDQEALNVTLNSGKVTFFPVLNSDYGQKAKAPAIF